MFFFHSRLTKLSLIESLSSQIANLHDTIRQRLGQATFIIYRNYFKIYKIFILKMEIIENYPVENKMNYMTYWNQELRKLHF